MTGADPDVELLVLARHGQTDANRDHVLDTRLPGPPLNATGAAQARALAALLADWPVRAVYASRMTRARQTAAPVAAAHGLPVEVRDGLHEVSVGDLQDRSDAAAREEFDRIYAAWWEGELDRRLPGGESAAEVRERYLTALDAIVAGGPGAVVVVSHGAAIRLAATALLDGAVGSRYVPNTGRVVLCRAGVGWVLHSWDEAPPEPGDVTGGAPE